LENGDDIRKSLDWKENAEGKDPSTPTCSLNIPIDED
jgi:hypothetical protein